MAKVVFNVVESFIDSNIIESYQEWNPATNYIFEQDEENLTSASMTLFQGWYYRSLSNENLDKKPANENNTQVDSRWTQYEPSNLLSILDLSAETIAKKTGDDLWFVIEQRYDIEAMVIGNFSAASIIIEYLDQNDIVLEAETYNYLDYNLVVDDWTYDYAPLSQAIGRNKLIYLKTIGSKIKVTLTNGGAGDTSIGYLSCGELLDIGVTIANINDTITTYIPTSSTYLGTKNTNSLIDQKTKGFITKAPVSDKVYIEGIATRLKLGIAAYIIDESVKSKTENEIILGQLENYNNNQTAMDKVPHNWSVKTSN